MSIELSARRSGKIGVGKFAAGFVGALSLSFAAAAQQQQQPQQQQQQQSPQQQQSQQRQQQQQPSDWSYSASASVHYDTFESDDGLIESDQVSEILRFSAGQNNVWYANDSLSFSARLGFAQAWPERGGNSDFVDATPTDTFLSAGYSTWDGQTSGFEVSLFTNLPTGPTDLSLTELAAIPNPKLVSTSVLSDGFQIGTEAQYHEQVDAWHLHGGFGYAFRSGISSFDTFSVDELEGGHDFSVILGADNQITERWNIGVNTVYTYSLEDQGSDNDYLSIRVPLTYLFQGGEATLSYTFSYSSSENRELSRAFRDLDETAAFLDGLRHTVALGVGYQVAEPFVLRGRVEASVGDASRSNDPAFFSTDDYYTVGLGGTYTLSQNLNLETWLKYFEVSTEGAAGGSTTFDGGSAMIALNYAF